ncbi:hypothetical protein EC957_004476 [Mortierella hygrophila]|uniref:Uncharacterized protein n=1 Tax=Mortierella hygrophila TaxID=979708 RepID=A0A9P6K0J2_9FUNG|nr:hypothetical protein EC957_004476 [Mortierella hygrophila]
MSFFFTAPQLSPFNNNNIYPHPFAIPTSTSTSKSQILRQFLFQKPIPIPVPMSLARPAPALLSNRSEPAQFIPAMNPSSSFTLTAVGLLSPKIKCQSDNKKEHYTFQSKSDAVNRNMTIKDVKGNQVCKVKNKGEHLLDLYLTTDSKDINVQFRDMVAFKKAVEKNGANGAKMPVIYQPGDEDDERSDPRYIEAQGNTNICWAFEFEGRIYQWTAPGGHGIHAAPGSDVLVCHQTGAGPVSKVARLTSSHTGASDKLTISNGSTATVLDKNGLQILLLTTVLSLMEIMNDRSRELLDFD